MTSHVLGLSFETLDALLQQKDFASLDFLLAQEGYEVRYEDGEWVWVQAFPHADLVVRGTPYTREQAYEDALRDIMGMIPIADERAQ